MFYKLVNNLVEIPLEDFAQHSTRPSRKHRLQFHQIRHSTKIYSNSFFPATFKDRNALPGSVMSTNSLDIFKDTLAKHFKN